MKRFSLALAALFCVVSSTLVHAETTVIRVSHVVKENTPKGIAAQYFADLVNERLKGEVRVEVYPEARLYNDHDAIRAVQGKPGESGLMIVPSLSLLQDAAPALKLFDLPGLFRDQDDIDKLTNSPVADRIVAQLRESGYHPLAFWHNGMRLLSLNTDASPETITQAFQGKTIRSEDSEVQVAFLQALGATPKVMDFSRLTEALDDGTLDGQANTWSNIYTQGIHHRQKVILEPGLTYLGYIVLVNRKFWDGLPDLTRRQLRWALGEATYQERKLARKLDARQRQRILTENAATIVRLGDEQLQQWRLLFDRLEEQFRDSIGSDVLEQVHRLLHHRPARRPSNPNDNRNTHVP